MVLPDMSSLDAVTRALPGGFYSTFRTYHQRTRVLGLRSHLDRLYRPAARLRLSPSIPSGELRRRLAALLSAFPSEEARVRVILSTDDHSGFVYAAIEDLHPLPEIVYRQGVQVITLHMQRLRPTLKSTGFIERSQEQRRQVAEQSVFEGLIVQDDRILEGLTSNFFYFLDGKLGTERRRVLNGVTRRQVLRLAALEGIPLHYEALRLAQLPAIAEAFLTSSSRGIVPIIAVNDTTIGTGAVGQGTRRLMEAYEADLDVRLEPIV